MADLTKPEEGGTLPTASAREGMLTGIGHAGSTAGTSEFRAGTTVSPSQSPSLTNTGAGRRTDFVDRVATWTVNALLALVSFFVLWSLDPWLAGLALVGAAGVVLTLLWARRFAARIAREDPLSRPPTP